MGAEYNPFSLSGKTVLITGASSGIGQETAIQCSKLGAQVIITGRNEQRLNETLAQMNGDGHRIIMAELTSQVDTEKLVEDICPLNGVVLCAGKGMILPFAFSTKDKYQDVFNVNYFAPVELLRILTKKKKLAKEASVVFVSSVGGNTVFAPGTGVYGASKAAINSTMRFCAVELATKKIRVNSVNPGRVNTKLIQNGAISEEQLQTDIEKYPLKRYGEPEDVAFSIIYLLSDASSWITGTSLIVDGGFSLK